MSEFCAKFLGSEGVGLTPCLLLSTKKRSHTRPLYLFNAPEGLCIYIYTLSRAPTHTHTHSHSLALSLTHTRAHTHSPTHSLTHISLFYRRISTMCTRTSPSTAQYWPYCSHLYQSRRSKRMWRLTGAHSSVGQQHNFSFLSYVGGREGACDFVWG